MCERTFLRPRDIIQFCNCILEAHRTNVNALPKFSNDDVLRGEERYSEFLYGEMEDEIHKHFPNYRVAFECLREVEYVGFSLKDFDEHWKRMNEADSGGLSAIQALEHLYSFSVIGFLQRGGRRGGTKLTWKYRDATRAFDKRATEFKVHPGFKRVLDLKKPRRQKD